MDENPFRMENLPAPHEYARAWKQSTGRPVVGYVCSYVPEEIIHAAGALPFRIFSGSESIHHADAHLQSYSCSLVRGVLEDALAGRLDFLDGMVFPHTCDTIQRLSDIWRMNVPSGFVLDIGVPAVLNTASGRRYMTEVFREFRGSLESRLGVAISEDRLQQSAGIFNEIRGGLRSLYALQRNSDRKLSGEYLDHLFRMSMYMDRETVAAGMKIASDRIPSVGVSPNVDAFKRVVLSGSFCDVSGIYRMVEAAGARVVGDDFCSGLRAVEGNVPVTEDMVAAIAGRHLDRVVCPAKHRGLFERRDHLIGLVQRFQADGVVFLLQKFCDPHAFDYPSLKSGLDEAGIPGILVEIGDRQVSEGQLRTRLEAFLEMV
jgi:bzd-type benzoyl-CoA reductase N subunit